MRLPAPPKRALPDSLLPMIDLVLFLIVFFMIASQFATPEPFAVAPPQAAEGEEANGEFTLFLSAAGEVAFISATQGARSGPEALTALQADRAAYCARSDCQASPPILLLRADLAAPGATLAALLPDLTKAGFPDIRLVTSSAGAGGSGEGSAR